MRLPFDNTYARLPEAFFVRLDPSPVSAPRWIAFNHELAETLGLDAAGLHSDLGLSFFSGNRVPEGADPIATAYAGHQFGGFSPQLGDGRAILLGETVGRDGVRRDIQLKGAGPTPFSRRGDGRSALGPVLREYLLSEAMFALGVPTTRALAAIWSGDSVYREAIDPGGVFTRVATSHLRVGTFEYFASRGDRQNLEILANYAITRHDPAATGAEVPALAFLEGVIARQARLVAHWLSLGFIHGVMNTDNTSISGETIDYGPCAFLDTYDPTKRFSFIDERGRYAYGNQPNIALWNLSRLAEALLPLLANDEDAAVERAQGALEGFGGHFEAAWTARFAAKIGIAQGKESDRTQVLSLLTIMRDQAADFTLTFRHLAAALEPGPTSAAESFFAQFRNMAPVTTWLEGWRCHLRDGGVEPEAACMTMSRANPVFIPRNHRIEEVIQAGRGGDFGPFQRLHEILQRPFEEQPIHADYEAAPQDHEVVQATFCGT
jgi:serine/tyrosine/threonine adenylyltransferase